jgi:hypothetical protein
MRYLFSDVQVKGRVICTIYHLQRSMRHLQFKVMYNKRNLIVDTGHPAGWINRTTERKDAMLSGQDCWSEVYIFFFNSEIFVPGDNVGSFARFTIV